MNSIEKFELTNLKIGYIVDKIDNGEIALPDIQRSFVWNTTKIRDLFDSLYKSLSIGTIILWEINKPIEYIKINLNDFKNIPNLLVIDGQQRLTSLYTIIKNREIISMNTKRTKLKIAFNPFIKKFEVSNVAIENDIYWISDISEIFGKGTYNFIESFKKDLKLN